MIQHLESDHLLVLQQADREEAKPNIPQSQAPANVEGPLPPNFTKLSDSWTPPHGVISATDSHIGIELNETLQKKELRVTTSKKGEPGREVGHSSCRLSEEEKVEVRVNQEPLSDINRSEITKISACSLEDRFDPRDSKTPDQVLSPPAAVEACGAEKARVKEETKCTSLSQEMNAGFPPTEVSGTLETGDLKMQREHTTIVGKVTTLNNSKAKQSLNKFFKLGEEKCESKDIMKSALEEDLEINVFRGVQALKNEDEQKSLQLESEPEKKTSGNVEGLDESIALEVAQSNENNTNKKSWSDEHGSCTSNIPIIQISTVEDMSNIKPPTTDLSLVEEFIIPKTEVLEPELKERSLPLSILALNKPEPHDLQKHDATDESKVVIQDESKAEFSGSFPTLSKMRNNDDLLPTEKVAQEMLEQPQSHSPAQTEYTIIPVIKVSCTDDLEGSVSSGSCTDRASEPLRESLFVVPPISVTCHESDAELKLPTPGETIETETSAGMQRGTKQSAENSISMKLEMPERSQDFEEIAEKSTKENTPAALCETLTPKVGENVPTPSKPTEDNTVPETLKLKSIKDAKNPSSVEDFLKSTPSVERLSSKPPTYPSLSPSSLRKFMSKAATDLDNESMNSVPVISVDDHQSDKADEDLSGGSTPTSSLSCESSPRLKRRDSLTLIRSATPEELASGARRKIFLPRSKEEIEGALVGVLEGKKENPYKSPSQARRAALLQTTAGQKTPPVERRSPLMSRRKATLEVPKVGDEALTGEPAGAKEDEKPSGKKADPLKGNQCVF